MAMADLSSVMVSSSRGGAVTCGGKRRHAWRVTHNAAGLRRFLVMKHPAKTADHVAAETGLPVRNVQRWLSDQPSEPSLSNFIRLFVVYGAPLLAASLTECPEWLDDHARLAKLAELERDIARAEAERTALLNRDAGQWRS